VPLLQAHDQRDIDGGGVMTGTADQIARLNKISNCIELALGLLRKQEDRMEQLELLAHNNSAKLSKLNLRLAKLERDGM